MARYRKYRYGGKRVPGMYAQEGEETPKNPTPPEMQSMKERPMMQVSDEATVVPRDTTNDMGMQMQNSMVENQMRMRAMQMQKMQQMMMELKMQNMLLQQQNQLQNTQIQKMDLINSARTTKKQVGSMNSPKRKGGIVRAKKGKRVEIISSGSSMMRKGGGLPGGRFSKKR